MSARPRTRPARAIAALALALALALAALVPPTPGPGARAAEGPGGLAVAAVDRSLYRDGEVRRRNERYRRWSLDCDEIVRLGQRFCSLRTMAEDRGGAGVARLTVSTDDAGRPAALIDLPFGVDVTRPVRIEPSAGLVLDKPSAALAPLTRGLLSGPDRGRAGGGAVATDALRARLPVALCDAGGCHAVWPLTPIDIAALRAGAGLRLSYDVPAARFGAPGARAAPGARTGLVAGEGFDQAVVASLRSPRP